MIKDLEGNDPIIACSTGSGHNTAIAVIRLSGFNFINDLQATFSVSLKKIRPRYVTRTKILRGNKVLDDALITYFPAPSSFTGENILELSVHGNQLLVMEILDTFCKYHGFRHAVPGEFSYRAYKNKKLTLNQIEGLDLLLNACSNFSKSQGLKILNGEIHEKFLELRTAYIELKSAVELKIDFSEDVGEEEADRLFFERNKKLKDLIEELYARTQGNNSNLLNPSVILIGKTNAGKALFLIKSFAKIALLFLILLVLLATMSLNMFFMKE